MTRYGLVALASLGFTQSALSNFPVTLNFSGVRLWEAGLTLDFHQLSSIPKDTPESPPTESPAVASAPRLLWRYWVCSPQTALKL